MGSSGASSTAGSPTLSTVILSDKMEEKIAAIQLQQEINNYKDEIKDLGEKLETVKVKRAQDQQKMKEFEKMVLQNEQLLEFKSRIMEAQNSLQKEVQKARHEAKEAIDAREQHAEVSNTILITQRRAIQFSSTADSRSLHAGNVRAVGDGGDGDAGQGDG